MKRPTHRLLVALGLAAAVAACGKSGGGTSPGDCDTGAGPDTESCLVADAYGVFAQPAAAANGDGTKAKPFAHLQQAIAAAMGSGKKVFACSDGSNVFAESIQIASPTKALDVYGGFHCADWSYDTTSQAVVRSPDPIAWQISGAHATIGVFDFEVDAPDGASPGVSSIALFVDGSDDVSFTRVLAKAGRGADGASATAVAAAGDAGPDGLIPNNTCLAPALGGGAVNTICHGVATVSFGGQGASGAIGTANGGNGQPGMPAASASGLGGGGQTVVIFDECEDPDEVAAMTGANGAAGPAGSGGAALGMLVSTGYQPSNGQPGPSGAPGQGGGGGGSARSGPGCMTVGSPGGGGGGGGCGGDGGGAGQGGGASIALASLSSTVKLQTVTLLAGVGGSGGNGGPGGPGGPGGMGGQAGDTFSGDYPGCGGGAGGQGGAGGPGGGGAGGPSIAIASLGTAPTVSDDTVVSTTFTTAPGGMGGGGTTVGAGAPGAIASNQTFPG